MTQEEQEILQNNTVKIMNKLISLSQQLNYQELQKESKFLSDYIDSKLNCTKESKFEEIKEISDEVK